MATANLTSSSSVDTTNDSVVIVENLEGIPGGRTLDVTGFADDEISAGHVIIRSDNAPKDYKPLPVSGTLPANHTYKGYLVGSLKKSNPQAAIMYAGTVNEAYCKYPIPTGAKTALNRVTIINE